MSGKGKTGRKGGKTPTSKPASRAPSSASEVTELQKEFYTIEINGLKDKYSKLTDQFALVKDRNGELERDMQKQRQDHADIIEYLKRKITEQESEILRADEKALHLVEEKERIDSELSAQLAREKTVAAERISKLEEELQQHIVELKELEEFRKQRAELIEQLDQATATLSAERTQHSLAIGDLERKLVLEKDRLKKEMMAKIKDAKASLLKMTDDRLESTTKRTMQENQQISAELAYQSKQTAELVRRNQALQKEMAELKHNQQLLEVSEQAFARKNSSNRKIIKILLAKIKTLEAETAEELEDAETAAQAQVDEMQDQMNQQQDLIDEMQASVDRANKYIEQMRHKQLDLQKQVQLRTDLLVQTANFLISTGSAIDRATMAGSGDSEDPQLRVTRARSRTQMKRLLNKIGSIASIGSMITVQATPLDMTSSDSLPELTGGDAPVDQGTAAETLTCDAGVQTEAAPLALLSAAGMPANPAALPGVSSPKALTGTLRPWGARAVELPLTGTKPELFLKKHHGAAASRPRYA